MPANVTPGAAGWIGLAAAPVFALMALWTAGAGDSPDILCASMGPSPLGGMTLMYLLMSAFHLAPWLRVFSKAFSSEVDTGSREENASKQKRESWF